MKSSVTRASFLFFLLSLAAAPAAAQHDALEDLDSLTAPFDDAHVHANGVAGSPALL